MKFMRQWWGNAWAVGVRVRSWELWIELSHGKEDLSRNWKDFSFDWDNANFGAPESAKQEER